MRPSDVDSGLETNPEDIKRVVVESLRKLTFIPDLYLVHSPFVPSTGNIGVFWKILEDLVEDGTLKGCSLGVSNFRTQDLEEVLKVARIKPVINRERIALHSVIHRIVR